MTCPDFARILRHYLMVVARTYDRPDVEDAVQDICLRLLTKGGIVTWGDARNYLRRMVRNAVITRARLRVPRVLSEAVHEPAYTPDLAGMADVRAQLLTMWTKAPQAFAAVVNYVDEQHTPGRPAARHVTPHERLYIHRLRRQLRGLVEIPLRWRAYETVLVH